MNCDVTPEMLRTLAQALHWPPVLSGTPQPLRTARAWQREPFLEGRTRFNAFNALMRIAKMRARTGAFQDMEAEWFQPYVQRYGVARWVNPMAGDLRALAQRLGWPVMRYDGRRLRTEADWNGERFVNANKRGVLYEQLWQLRLAAQQSPSGTRASTRGTPQGHPHSG